VCNNFLYFLQLQPCSLSFTNSHLVIQSYDSENYVA
jgi:hypothetical protein